MLRSNNIYNPINNKFVYFDKYKTFHQHEEMGLIPNDSIVFVGEGLTTTDGPFIWTHGKIFGAAGIIEYIHNFVNNNATSINAALAEQLAQLKALIDAEHKSITDDANAALDKVKQDLEAAEEKIKWLQEHGSDEDKIEHLMAILYDEIGKVNADLVEYNKKISAINGIIEETFAKYDIDGKIKDEYNKVIDLVNGYVQEELRKVNLDERIVQVVGRYMESGLLKDYVTYALLSDEKTITSFAERLLEANDDYAAIKDIASWKNSVTETLSALQEFANKDFASWLLTAEWATSEEGFDKHIASIFGEASKDGSFILMIAERIIASGKFLFQDGNNCISITKEGIRLWVDDGDGIYEPDEPDNEQSNFFLGSDGHGYIGKLGKDSDGKDAHPIEWLQDGSVKVQSVVVEGADLNAASYKSEYRFAKITRSAAPSPLSSMLPSNSSNPDAETVIGKDKNNNNINWTKNALSGTRGDAIYMIIRQNKVDSLDNYIKDGAGNYGIWQGPYCISGEDGSLGTDSAGINFIYRASNTQIVSGETGLTGLTFDPNTETFNRTTDWKNKASDAQISADKKYSYMAFSVDAVFETDTNGNPTKVIKYWLNYSGPILWSVWGDTGIDGDGVEYIFCVTSDESLADVSDPYGWYSATGSYLTEEYINSTHAGANGTNPELNKWYDDPQKMTVGQYQWVSKRTYTWKTEIDGLPKKSDGKEWKRYSHPQLWSHYATDGVTSGYIVNVTNPSIIVSVNKDGLLLGNEGEAVGDFTHEIHWNIYKTGGITPTFTTNIADETPTPLTPYYTVSTSVNTQPVSSTIAAQARQLQSGANEWHYADIIEDNGDLFANLVIVNYSTVKATNDAYDPDTSGTITEDPYYDSTGSSITDYSNLNLILNNVIVNLRFLIYEGGANPYVIDRAVQVCGVYTGQPGPVGSMIDLKVSTKAIYVDRYTGELSPSIVSVLCVESKGDYLTVYYPDDGNSSLFKFGYTKGVLTEPTLENTTRLTTAQIDITNPSLFDQDNYDPITIYLFALKGRDWIPVDFETVGYLLSGESGVGSFVTTVYCRTNETPVAPTGGSYDDAMPNTPKPANVANDVACTRYLVYKDDGGSMVPVYKTGETTLNSNLVEWEDTIPEGVHILWESRCTFRSDVTYSEDPSTTPKWTKPRQVTDIHDVYDVEFALELDVYDGLSSTEIEDNEPEDSNRHGGSGILVWFDPDLDKDAELPGEKTWKNMVWRAERWRINGEWTDWIITYIKGEKGPSGDGYNLTASGFEEKVLYMIYDNLGRKESENITIPVQLHFGDNIIEPDAWTMDVASTFSSFVTVDKTNKVITVTGVPPTSGNSMTITATTETGDILTLTIQVERLLGSHYEVRVSPSALAQNTTTHVFGNDRYANVTVSVVKLLDLQKQTGWLISASNGIAASSSLSTDTDKVFVFDAQLTYPSAITFTAKPAASYTTYIEGTLTILANADGNTPNPPDPNIDYKLVVDGSATYNVSTKNLSFNISAWHVHKNDGNVWSEYASNNDSNSKGISVEYKASDSEFNTLTIGSYNEYPDNVPGSILFIAKYSGNVISYCYMPVSIIAEGAEINYDTLAEKVGDLGKLFVMLGEFDPTVQYTIQNGYTPLVYFHEQGQEHGYWWELILSNTETDTTQTPSKTYRYAPGEYPTSYTAVSNTDSGRGLVVDYVGRKFDWRGVRSGTNPKFTYTNSYWRKVDRFNTIITDAIFADFAKFGSAIISGDYMFSKWGKIGNTAYNNDNGYLKFNPNLSLINSSTVELLNNPLEATYTGTTSDLGTALGIDIFVGVKSQSCSIQIELEPLIVGLESYEYANIGIGLSGTNFVSISEGENLNADKFDKYRGKMCHLYIYRSSKNAHTGPVFLRLTSVTLTSTDVFKPNWCVDLKTGKMIAGGGNFVVEPDGTTTIGKSNIVANSNGSITAAGGKFAIDVDGNLIINGASYIGNTVIQNTDYRYCPITINLGMNNQNPVLDTEHDCVLLMPVGGRSGVYANLDYSVTLPNPASCIGKKIDIYAGGSFSQLEKGIKLTTFIDNNDITAINSSDSSIYPFVVPFGKVSENSIGPDGVYPLSFVWMLNGGDEVQYKHITAIAVDSDDNTGKGWIPWNPGDGSGEHYAAWYLITY